MDDFVRLHDKIRRHIFGLDVSVPLGVLAKLIVKEKPKADVAGHPQIAKLLSDLRLTLDRRFWRLGATADPVEATPTSADVSESRDPLEFPLWRGVGFRNREMAHLVSFLVQHPVDDAQRSLLRLALERSVQAVPFMGHRDLPRLIWAVQHAPGVVPPAGLHDAIVARLPSQVALMDVPSVASAAGYVASWRGAGAPSTVATALARRLAELVDDSAAPGRGGPRRSGAEDGRDGAAIAPSAFSHALSELARAGVRTDAAIARAGKGYSAGGREAEVRLSRFIIVQCRRWDARTIAIAARACGVMGLSLDHASNVLPEDGTPQVSRRTVPEASATQGRGGGRRGNGGGAKRDVAGATGADESGGSSDRLWGALEARAASLLPSLSPLDLSFVATSFAQASRAVTREASEALAQRALARAKLLRSSSSSAGAVALGVATTPIQQDLQLQAVEDDAEAAALASVRVGSDRLWTGLRTAILARLPEFSLNDVAWTAWAMAEAGMGDPDFVAACAGRANELLGALLAVPPLPAPPAEAAAAPSGGADTAAEPGASPAPAEGGGLVPGWGEAHWAALGALLAGAPLVTVAGSAVRALSVLPPATVAGASLEDPTAVEPYRLHAVMGAVTGVTATAARAVFEAAVARGGPHEALARRLVPASLADFHSLLSASLAYRGALEATLEAGLVSVPAPQSEGEATAAHHPIPPDALAALSGACEQLAVGVSLHVLQAPADELRAGAAAAPGLGRLAQTLQRAVATEEALGVVRDAIAKLEPLNAATDGKRRRSGGAPAAASTSGAVERRPRQLVRSAAASL